MRNPTKVPFSNMTLFPLTLARVSLKVWIFLLALAIVQLYLGYRLGGRPGLWIGFLWSVSFISLIYFFADARLLKKFKVRKLSGQDAWNLTEMVDKYSRLAGVPRPDIFLMDHPTPIAFSMGSSWNQARICLSTGALQKLTNPEIEAVLAHQVCHLRRLEMFSFAVSSSVANSLIGLAQVLDRAWPANWGKKKPRQFPFLTLLSPLAGLILRIALSDRSYFEIDDLAQNFLVDRKALATALWKLESYCQAEPLDILPCTNHLFIVNPEGLKESNWFFVTHPKMENRLKRLAGTYPL